MKLFQYLKMCIMLYLTVDTSLLRSTSTSLWIVYVLFPNAVWYWKVSYGCMHCTYIWKLNEVVNYFSSYSVISYYVNEM
jgi:hypothetical protein